MRANLFIQVASDYREHPRNFNSAEECREISRGSASIEVEYGDLVDREDCPAVRSPVIVETIFALISSLSSEDVFCGSDRNLLSNWSVEAMRDMRFMMLAMLIVVASSTAVPAAEPIRLWEGDVPAALGKADHDIPTLTPFLPAEDKVSGLAIVVCPGGGYGGLAGHEGEGYAKWLASNGISAFVLKYRLGSKGYRHPVMLGDVSRAIRLVRSKASEWKIDPKRVGVMGSSAGGHLASTAVTHFDSGKPDSADVIEGQSSRPDFGVLCYAVISMQDGVTHAGSKRNLLGEAPSAELVEFLSNEKQVTKDTPPCFVWSTQEDKAVPVLNSLQFVMALEKAGVPYDFHVYQKGPHGIGLSEGRNGVPANDVHPWAKDLLFWLRQNGLLKQ